MSVHVYVNSSLNFAAEALCCEFAESSQKISTLLIVFLRRFRECAANRRSGADARNMLNGEVKEINSRRFCECAANRRSGADARNNLE